MASPLAPSSAPTGPRGLPGVGALLAFARDPLRFVEEMARRHGDVARFPVAGNTTFLVSHPDAIKQVLVDRAGDEIKDQITRGLVRVLGHGLLTSEGDVWRRQRRRAAPSFGRAEVAVYGRAIVARAERMAERIGAREVRDVHADAAAVTLDVVVETLFAHEARGVEAVGPTVCALLSSYRRAFIGPQRFLPAWAPTRSRRVFRRAVREIDEVLAGIVRDARAAGRRGDDLLSHLLAATDDEGRAMDDRQLRDEIVTLFLAGHETTAIALTTALYLLASHPDVAARARAEIDAVLADRPAEAADAARLPFVDAIVREAMRLYPPAWIVGREAVRDVTIGGVTIPAGGQILASQWVVHRDARWFPEPTAFRPGRWLDGSTASIPRFAYFPFGGGPRICIGNHFAMLEAILILATLIRRIDVDLVPESRLELSPAVTLRPASPVYLAVTARRA
jgi:cytochrome P450